MRNIEKRIWLLYNLSIIIYYDVSINMLIADISFTIFIFIIYLMANSIHTFDTEHNGFIVNRF